MRYNEIMDRFDNASLLRRVEAVDLHLPDGTVVPNRKAIVHEDDGSYVSTVGNRYRIAQNEEIFSNFADALTNSGLDLSDLAIDASSSATGARHLAKITLPNHSVDVGKVGDVTALQLLVRNSHDGTWKFKSDVGGFRLACTNGQVIGDYENVFSYGHTARFEVPALVSHLTHAVDVFARLGHEWTKMRGMKVDFYTVVDVLLDYIGKRVKDNAELEKVLLSKRATKIDDMLYKYEHYAKEVGHNFYAVYNAMTDDATHFESDSPADTEAHRHKQLVSALKNHFPH